MSSKRTADFPKSIVDGDMSGNLTSISSNILHMDRAGFQIVFTGSPTGTFSVQVSNDEVSWIDVTLTTPITAAGSGDEAFIDVESAAKFVRLVYTFGSGTGVLNVHLVGKSISG